MFSRSSSSSMSALHVRAVLAPPARLPRRWPLSSSLPLHSLGCLRAAGASIPGLRRRSRRDGRPAGSSASSNTSLDLVDEAGTRRPCADAPGSPRRRLVSFGAMTSFMPLRCAASAFSLRPPIGSTWPVRVISPGHRDVAAHRAPGDQRRERGGHRDARARAVLGDRAGGHVDVQVVRRRTSPSAARARLARVAAHVGQRRLRPTPHDVAELAGDVSLPLPGIAVASTKSTSPPTGVHASPVATPGLARAPARLGVEARPPEQLARPRFADDVQLARRACPRRPRARPCGRPSRSRARGCARRPRACSRSMIARSAASVNAICDFAQPVALDLARHQVALGDLELLLLGVAGELDDLHAVAQRPGIGSSVVRRADEEDLREVERQVEVVVAEASVLLGVEHLEHRARPGRRGSPRPSCRSRRS